MESGCVEKERVGPFEWNRVRRAYYLETYCHHFEHCRFRRRFGSILPELLGALTYVKVRSDSFTIRSPHWIFLIKRMTAKVQTPFSLSCHLPFSAVAQTPGLFKSRRGKKFTRCLLAACNLRIDIAISQLSFVGLVFGRVKLVAGDHSGGRPFNLLISERNFRPQVKNSTSDR